MEDRMLEEDLDSYGRRQRSIKLGYTVEPFEQPRSRCDRIYPGNNLKTLFKKRKRVVIHQG